MSLFVAAKTCALHLGMNRLATEIAPVSQQRLLLLKKSDVTPAGRRRRATTELLAAAASGHIPKRSPANSEQFAFYSTVRPLKMFLQALPFLCLGTKAPGTDFVLRHACHLPLRTGAFFVDVRGMQGSTCVTATCVGKALRLAADRLAHLRESAPAMMTVSANSRIWHEC